MVLFPIRDASKDPLKDRNKKKLSPQSNLKSKKLVNLLSFPPTRTGKYYMFKGVLFPAVMLLPRCITDLKGMKTSDLVSRSDVTFTSSEIEEVESAACTLLEASFWSVILEKCNDEAKCYCLFVAGARTQMMVALIS